MEKQTKFSSADANTTLIGVLSVCAVLLVSSVVALYRTLTTKAIETLEQSVSPIESKAGVYFEQTEKFASEASAALLKADSLLQDFRDSIEIQCNKSSNPQLCYYWAAQAFTYPKFCALSRTGLKNECYRVLAQSTKDSAVCENIDDSKEKTRCEAATKNDVSLCKQLSDPFDQTTCVYDVAGTQGSADVCTNVSPDVDYNRQICYSKVAREKRDPQFCDKICQTPVDANACRANADSWRGYCYMTLGIVSQQSQYCDKTFTSDEKYYCLGVTTKNVQECNKIIDSGDKSNCLAIVTSSTPVDLDTLFGP